MLFFQYKWEISPPIEFNLDNVDQSKLKLPKGSLRGGSVYTVSVFVIMEKNGSVLTSEASVTLEVQVLGVSAMVTPTELKVGYKSSFKLSALLSQDLDNTNDAKRVRIQSTLFRKPLLCYKRFFFAV